ncbi:early nodulin-75-like [Diaphorina citri]|uniref:Early nodulin-75-like n=1 Tax=Diaphorina citri TaxID=121845 RepID=A0A1S3D8L2_DIACI|nr:early nodulin-75-like [Diaphorina citri]
MPPTDFFKAHPSSVILYETGRPAYSGPAPQHGPLPRPSHVSSSVVVTPATEIVPEHHASPPLTEIPETIHPTAFKPPPNAIPPTAVQPPFLPPPIDVSPSFEEKVIHPKFAPIHAKSGPSVEFPATTAVAVGAPCEPSCNALAQLFKKLAKIDEYLHSLMSKKPDVLETAVAPKHQPPQLTEPFLDPQHQKPHLTEPFLEDTQLKVQLPPQTPKYEFYPLLPKYRPSPKVLPPSPCPSTLSSSAHQETLVPQPLPSSALSQEPLVPQPPKPIEASPANQYLSEPQPHHPSPQKSPSKNNPYHELPLHSEIPHLSKPQVFVPKNYDRMHAFHSSVNSPGTSGRSYVYQSPKPTAPTVQAVKTVPNPVAKPTVSSNPKSLGNFRTYVINKKGLPKDVILPTVLDPIYLN